MIHTELTLLLPNSPGALAGVCRLLADDHVRVIALMLDAHGQLRFVADNPVRAMGVLRAAHHAVAERDVLVARVSPQPEALAAVLTLVSDAGVNLEYAYTSTGDPGGSVAVVMGVDDVQRAAARTGI